MFFYNELWAVGAKTVNTKAYQSNLGKKLNCIKDSEPERFKKWIGWGRAQHKSGKDWGGDWLV